MIIRSAVVNDIKQIVEIGLECRLGNWTESDYRNDVERSDSLILVAAIRETAIGFLSARLNGYNLSAPVSEFKEDLAGGEDSGRACGFTESDIVNFGVLEKFRKSGIATALLSEFKARAVLLNVKSVWLEVRQSNISAVNLYRKNGFLDVQTRKNFYTNPSDNAIIMKLKL